ncbi:MAG: hypothetical protein IKT45_09600 [Lachnospiraceae bacterium]|nr:hypothetical protein [Lachnospiraceae bacterium]
MLYRIFSQVLSMSLTGSIVVLFVLLARWVLKKSPRIFSYGLWAIVLFRLLCPVAPVSELSLLNLLSDPIYSLQSQKDQAFQSHPEYIVDHDMMAQTPVLIPDSTTHADPLLESVPYATYDISSPRVNAIRLGSILWITGSISLLAYSLHTLWQLHCQLKTAVPLRDNIYLADYITTPFVLGLLRPRIYLPSSLPVEQQSYILLHEQHHIRRLDHLWKLIAFVTLCIHWFNPLVWLAFVLAGKDMEMSCDEAVLRRMGNRIRADYSASLLTLSTGHRIYAAMPLAFGEGDTKDRIRHVLAWKKPRTWIVIVALLTCLVLAISLSTDPSCKSDLFGARYSVKEILYDAPQYSFTYTVDTAPEFTITSDHVLLIRDYVDLKADQTDATDQWQTINGLYEVDYSRHELYAFFESLYCNVHERLDQVKRIYRAEPFNVSASIFYLVMETKNGDILLAQGYGREGEENQHIRWLFQLEQQSGSYELDVMCQALKETYGQSAVYFSLYQCDTTPDTILLGFQVGTGDSKGPSAVGYAAFHYDKATDNYLLAHSEVLPYQVTGLYPVKLTSETCYDTNLQIILSTREDLHAVRIASNRPDTKNFQMEKAIYNETGGPAMYVFECPDTLTLQTLDIKYIYEETDNKPLDSISPLFHLIFHLVPEDSEESTLGIPTLILKSKHEFQFSYDMLSSYLPYGMYTIRGNILTAITYDGQYQYRFEIINGDTLRFLQDGISDVSLIDERLGTAIHDGDLFVREDAPYT